MSPTRPDLIANVIRGYYAQQMEQEWERLEQHRTEFAITMRSLEEHLPVPPARILDCGGGPGRYAIELARRGYAVTLFDLSPEALRVAQTKAEEAGVPLAGYEQGTVTDLSRFADDSFDAVLLMGPLYPLLTEGDHRQALAEAYRVLKPGGPAFAAFISRYAGLRHATVHAPNWPLEQPHLLASILETGILPPRGEADRPFVAYLAHPGEVAPLCQQAGFDIITVLGVEGLASMIEEGVNALSGPAWDAWVDLNARVAADPTIHGCVEHLLVVARKPRWPAVLRETVRQLEEAGIIYKVVGGASVALQGVSVPVKDIDIETDAAGAYRFQSLFAGQAEEPVTWSESAVYRSHFGRFDFAGVMVEIMGDLERREAGAWVPTATTTERVVDLDSVPVHVSWLEEEVLAYIRRGRLDRAAACLPHCDHGRLLALLRKDSPAGVL